MKISKSRLYSDSLKSVSPYWPVLAWREVASAVWSFWRPRWTREPDLGNQWVGTVFISYSGVMIGKFPENSMPDGCKCKNSSRFFPPASLSVVRVHRTLHRGVAHRPPHVLYGTWCQTRCPQTGKTRDSVLPNLNPEARHQCQHRLQVATT